jgi:hypothetical protein
MVKLWAGAAMAVISTALGQTAGRLFGAGNWGCNL